MWLRIFVSADVVARNRLRFTYICPFLSDSENTNPPLSFVSLRWLIFAEGLVSIIKVTSFSGALGDFYFACSNCFD